MDVDTPTSGRRRNYAARLVLALVTIGAVALVAAVVGTGSLSARRASEPAGTSPGTGTPTPTATSTPSAAAAPIRLVAVGDSITVAGGDIPTGRLTELSWVHYAVGAPVVLSGGWAVSGATTAQMAAGFAPPPSGTYVLVIFGGTNDVGLDLPFAKSAPQLVAIADRAQGAVRVFVTAIPPLTGREAQAARYNANLAALAAQRGWRFVDPMAAVSNQGRWLDGMSHDGIHPTAEGARRIGTGIRAAVLAS